MQSKILTTFAAFALMGAVSAQANGNGPPSVSVSLDLDLGGNAGIEGSIQGGTYALGKNGSDAFAQSSNVVKGWGLSTVDVGESFNTGKLSSWGKSVAKTNGQGAKAEAFETRDLSFDNFTKYSAYIEFDKSYPGYSGFNQ